MLCWSIGWLVGWSVGGLLVCSHSNLLYCSRTHSLTHSLVRTSAGAIYIIALSLSVYVCMCKYLSYRLSCNRQHTYTISIRTYADTHSHSHTHIDYHAERWLIYEGLDYPCQWYQLVIPKSQIRQTFQAPILPLSTFYTNWKANEQIWITMHLTRGNSRFNHIWIRIAFYDFWHG